MDYSFVKNKPLKRLIDVDSSFKKDEKKSELSQHPTNSRFTILRIPVENRQAEFLIDTINVTQTRQIDRFDRGYFIMGRYEIEPIEISFSQQLSEEDIRILMNWFNEPRMGDSPFTYKKTIDVVNVNSSGFEVACYRLYGCFLTNFYINENGRIGLTLNCDHFEIFHRSLLTCHIFIVILVSL